MFLEKFADNEIPSMLLKELGSLKMEGKVKVKYFNQRFTHILNKFSMDTKPHDSIIVDYYTSTLLTSIAQFVKRATKPKLLESCKEVVVVQKDLHVIEVIRDEESTKDSKDESRKPQARVSKGRDKEEIDIENLTCLVKNLTTEVFEIKQRKTDTFASSDLPRQR